MKRYLFSLTMTVLVAATIQLNAAPIPVRSGEHADFTRLVIRLPPDTTWVSQALAGSLKLTFDGVADGFETSRIFDVIPRTRIGEVSTSANSIAIMFSCDCEAKTFLEAGNYLVIDVSEVVEKPLVQTRFEESEPRNAISSFGYGELIWVQPDNSLRSESVSQSSEIGTGLPVDSNLLSYEQTMMPHLLSAIGNAASRGILRTKRPSPNASDNLMELGQPTDLETQSEEPERHPEEPLVAADHVKISNSSEIAPTEAPTNLSMSRDSCPVREVLSFSQDELNASFSEQVGFLRSTLYDSRDGLHEASVRDLARLYLMFGFGAEARATLSLAPMLLRQNLVLVGVADVLEQRTNNDFSVFEGFEVCESDWALWSFLASGKIGDDQVVNDSAILRALTALPESLRNALARRVSDRFLELGNTEAAALALRSVQNTLHPANGSPNLTEVKILSAQNENVHAISLLSELANSSTGDSPRALIELVQEAVEQEQTLTAELALLADTYAFEFKDSPIGNEMLETLVLASALSGQFNKAFEHFYRNHADTSGPSSKSLLSDIFGILVRHPDDIVFLEFALSKTLANDLGGELILRDRIAKRLTVLGFPQQAYALITQPDRTSEGYKESALLEQSGSQEPVVALPNTTRDLELSKSAEQLAAENGPPQGSEVQAIAEPADSLPNSFFDSDSITEFPDLIKLTRTRLEPDKTNPETLSVISAMLSQSEADRLELVRILSAIPRP